MSRTKDALTAAVFSTVLEDRYATKRKEHVGFRKCDLNFIYLKYFLDPQNCWCISMTPSQSYLSI
jgi:hypothetical protein